MILEFDKTIWTALPVDGETEIKKWHDGNGVQLILDNLGIDHNLRAKLGDGEIAVREYYRNVYASQGIGIVQCDIIPLSGVSAVKVIGKQVTRGKPAVYAGSLAIPLPDKSFVLSLYSYEVGVTGVRDTAIFTVLSEKGQGFQIEAETGKMIGWACDPYFPDFQGPCLKNMSEDEQYDSMFPEHPLTKVRMRLAELTQSTRLRQEAGGKKPWWKLW